MRATFNLKKAGLLILAGSLFFVSCKKDDKDNNGGTNPTPAAAKLKKVSQGDDTIEFGYAADGSLQNVKVNDDFLTNGDLTTFTVVYNPAKQISELRASDGSKIVAHYENNELTSSDMYDETSTLIFSNRYEYLNGVLKSVVSGVGGVDALKFSFNYDAAGNVSKTSTWGYNPATGQLQATGSTTHEYDSKTNPLFAHKTLLYLLFQNPAKNNITKETDLTVQNVVDETREYTYQYNNQNLPQSATVKTTPAGQPSTTATILYSYQ